MSRRKRPPLKSPDLKSPDWLPLNDAYDRLLLLRRSDILAVRDLNVAFRAGAVHTMKRPVGGDQDDELLPLAFWKANKIKLWNNGVAPVTNTDTAIWPQFYVFVWEPDFKKNFGSEIAAVTESKKSAKTPTKMGAPAQHDWIKITAEIGRRVHVLGARNRGKLAGDMEDYCERELKKVPDRKNILKAIKEVMDRRD